MTLMDKRELIGGPTTTSWFARPDYKKRKSEDTNINTLTATITETCIQTTNMAIRLIHAKDKMRHERQLVWNQMYLLLGLAIVCLLARCQQSVSATMSLPDGIENMLGFVPQSSFQCERDGYFGDTENDCRLFHLCQRTVNSNGKVVSNFSAIPFFNTLNHIDTNQ